MEDCPAAVQGGDEHSQRFIDKIREQRKDNAEQKNPAVA
jgi:hypothetical protein